MADAVRNAAGEYEATDQGLSSALSKISPAMIPARSVLATWRTTELAELGESFRIDGKAISVAGDRVGQQIASRRTTMPGTVILSGRSGCGRQGRFPGRLRRRHRYECQQRFQDPTAARSPPSGSTSTGSSR